MASDDDILKQAAEHFRKVRIEGPGAPDAPPEEVEARRRHELNEKEVKVMGVYEYPHGAFVLLRDGRGRNLPIWIGQEQMVAIAWAIEGNSTPRPMTHDLTKLLIERLGGTIEYILVDDLHNNVYYAKLALRQGERQAEVDCRPSDAIALALRFKTPIYVADHVLEEGHWPEAAEE